MKHRHRKMKHRLNEMKHRLNEMKHRLNEGLISPIQARLDWNLQQIVSPLKPIKSKARREVVQFYIAHRAAVKNAVYCNRIYSSG
jgi:hypothetical protein